MKSVFFLDDDPERTKKFLETIPHARCFSTAQSIIAELKEGVEIDFLFLDHDLGGKTFVDSKNEDCGMEVIRYLLANKRNIGIIVVHTCNTYAGTLMTERLEGAGYLVAREPFTRFNWDSIKIAIS
ncbi:MAG: hypothetical protein E6R03_18155 [Hyphomicrobiaceae bacterium]|nr:MAG: hypothetical protein E6R03_18155 [Hyphomicrobiaceae bacterium]